MDLLSDLKARGLLNDSTDEQGLANHLAEGSKVLYCGFDPTADSLHIGSLVPLLVLKRFQMAGHKPMALVGGATGLIGDPSFKAKERSLQADEVVATWVEKLKVQVSRFLDFASANQEPVDNKGSDNQYFDNTALVVNNLDWTKPLSVVDFLRDIGKHFSVNQMIQKEAVKQRIDRDGAGISFTEFSYSLLQSLDFAELNRSYQCTVQIGGSDQWGNITAGIDLTRRLNRQQVYGLTLPLITKSDGTKFGKTESGTLWLDSERTSPYSFYQFWLNTADADVYRFLKYFTFLPLERIDAIQSEDAIGNGKPAAQRILAEEVTRIVHGEAALKTAEKITEAMQKGDYSQLSDAGLAQLAQDGIESVHSSMAEMSLERALVETKLAKTNTGQVTVGQARKLINANSISVNGEKISDSEYWLNSVNALSGCYHFIKRGKKEVRLLVLEADKK